MVNFADAFSTVNKINIKSSNTGFSLSGTNNNDNEEPKKGFFSGLSDFWTDFDNFLDDASARRLGNGAAFYGKRKSNFYGKDDKNKKTNSKVSDPIEDYQAPNDGGYFQWMQDEDGQMRPVTRMKKQIIERSPKFWDRLYDNDNKDDKDK